MKLPGPPSRVRSRSPEEISPAASASFNYAPALDRVAPSASAYEAQLVERRGGLIVFEFGNRFFLVAVFERHARGRIAERKSFFQQSQIVGYAGAQAGVVQKIRCELRLRGRHHNQPGVTPIQLRHALARVQAVRTLGVEKENKNASYLRGEW